MKHTLIITLILSMALPVLAQNEKANDVVTAEDCLSAEIHSGVAFATENLGNTKLGTGLGFGGTLAYRFMPHRTAYAGWDWNEFSAHQSFAGQIWMLKKLATPLIGNSFIPLMIRRSTI